MDVHLIPALSVRGDFAPALMSALVGLKLYEVELDPTDVIRIQIDNEFKTLVAERFDNGDLAFRNLNGTLKAAELVIEAIEAAEAD